MRPITTLMTCLVFLALAAVPAFSAHPHFLEGPTCCQENSSVTCTGDIAGLGGENIDVIVTASGTTTCTNRGAGGQEPPGLNTTATGSETNIKVKNGRTEFAVTATAENPCPDRMIATTTFTSATITVVQPSGGEIPADVVLTEEDIPVPTCGE